MSSSINGGKTTITRTVARARRRSRTPNTDGSNKSGKKSNSNTLESVPSLKEFMRQKSVLHQYRSFLRHLYYIDDEAWRNQLISDVTSMYRKNASQSDPMGMKMAFQDGERQLAQLVSLVGHNKGVNSVSSEDNSVEDDKTKINDTNALRDPSQNDPDSWINTPDNEDPRGRVGTKWPWQT